MSHRYQHVLADLPQVQTEPEMLDQARKRLHGLSTSLEQLANKLRAYDALPTWESLQATNDEFSGHLSRIRGILTDPQIQPFLRSAHPYPLPTFPGAQQQAMLSALTRKRFEIPVQNWSVATRKAGLERLDAASSGAQLDESSLQDLWDWAPLATGDVFRKAVLSGGTQGEEDNEDDAEAGDAMEGVQKDDKSPSEKRDESAVSATGSMDLARYLPFMLTGILPPVVVTLPPATKR